MNRLLLSFLILVLIASCKQNDNNNLALSQKVLDDFQTIKKKHRVHNDIIGILSQFSNQEKITSQKNQDTITLTLDNKKLILLKDSLIGVKNNGLEYIIKNKNKILFYTTIFNNSFNGNLNNEVFNGDYITLNKDFYYIEKLQNDNPLEIKELYLDGSLKKEIFFEKGLINGVVKEYHSNGIKKNELNYSNGVKDGIFQTWFENGGLESSVRFVNGKKNGDEIFYYGNTDKRTMRLKSNFIEGKKEGLESAWYPEAKSKYRCNYTDGQINGDVIVYNKNKNLNKMNGSYAYDQRNGQFNIYDDEGKTIFSGFFELGEITKITKGTDKDFDMIYDIESLYYK